MEKRCSKCLCTKPTSEFFKRSISRDGITAWCKLCASKCSTEYTRHNVLRLKEEIFKKLGRACVRCGFLDTRALQIDHVNGDGFKTRRKISPYTYLKQVLADESGSFQILCANCNWIKRHENGEHEHRQIQPN